ncbi:2-Methylisocitrate lyase, PEP mutase family [Filimonas lacunae]|uniref:2-Methylisocitrate lyase, PEP mutase family n=1 Tax=Filimonas lacunae TaxID=477680 RepID=A0A173MB18_9BACT|nr:isocitrate lyase/phosphoenolpyruvate mutase family protein [Filimonas lacunae]BAV04754.1 carboxyvinyl-carboxyphosphonate phosphorylmutase [Filimonas lacunae]SIT32170.1 2-Methylisocitrate lyase, PEP mutase family [Filimonas lacunae]
MAASYEVFRALHYSNQLLVLPNVWDAQSALRFQVSYKAIGTSSSAVAGSLGYEDGENMSFEEYLFVIKRIVAVAKVPVTVDLEMGYGATVQEIARNILTLAQLGVAGINIEDSVIQASQRTLGDAVAFADNIRFIKEQLVAAGKNVFINIRCDTYLLDVEGKQQETEKRLLLYNTTGADGIFLPCITEKPAITASVNVSELPLNVMCYPGLPSFVTLQQLGVKRVSMGPFVFSKAYENATLLTGQILEAGSFAPVLS